MLEAHRSTDGPRHAGVMDEPNCMWKSEDLDHAVLLVGYGTCPMTGKDYWLIRNSWSTHWGDKASLDLHCCLQCKVYAALQLSC